MVTGFIRIVAWFLTIDLIMSAHWIWAIVTAIFALGFYINVDGKRI